MTTDEGDNHEQGEDPILQGDLQAALGIDELHRFKEAVTDAGFVVDVDFADGSFSVRHGDPEPRVQNPEIGEPQEPAAEPDDGAEAVDDGEAGDVQDAGTEEVVLNAVNGEAEQPGDVDDTEDAEDGEDDEDGDATGNSANDGGTAASTANTAEQSSISTSDDADDADDDDSEDDRLTCQHCGNQFKSVQGRSKHENSCTGDTHECSECGEEFASKKQSYPSQHNCPEKYGGEYSPGDGDGGVTGDRTSDDTDANSDDSDRSVMQERADRLDAETEPGTAYERDELAAIAFDIPQDEVGASERGTMSKIFDRAAFAVRSTKHPDGGKRKLYYYGETPALLQAPSDKSSPQQRAEQARTDLDDDDGERGTGKNRPGTRPAVTEA